MLSSAKKRYLLAAYELGEDSDQGVRSKDIAKKLHVQRPSASKMIHVLCDEGLFHKEYSGKVYVTAQGFRYANRLYTDYLLLFEYFAGRLSIREENARKDAMTCLCDLSEEDRQSLISLVLANQCRKNAVKNDRFFLKYFSEQREGSEFYPSPLFADWYQEGIIE